MREWEEGRESRPVEHEIRREAARILPKLADDAGYIERLVVESSDLSGTDYGVFTRRNHYRRSIARVREPIVQGFIAMCWIAESDGRLVLSDDGDLWLRRHRAGAEPFLEQHQVRKTEYRDVGGARRTVLVNRGESPLGWLRRRRDRNGSPMITEQQFEAGERLRAEFERAQLTPSITSNWESAAPTRRMRRAAPGGPGSLSDDAIAFRQRVMRALEAVGPELSGVLIDVCCHLLGLADAEKSRGWPQRSGKVILQIALTRLARHYGLLEHQDRSVTCKNRIRHWGADDFRPSLEQWR